MASCPAVARYIAEDGASDPVSRAAISGLVSEGHRLAHERRRRSLSEGRKVESCDELDARWRRLGADALRGLRDGATPEFIRSDFAGRFPFLGLVEQRHVERCRERQRAVVERLRAEGRKFLPSNEALLHPLEPEEEEGRNDLVEEEVAQEEGLPEVADLPDPLADIDLTSAISALTAAATAASAAEAQLERGPLLRLSEPAPVVEEEDADVFRTGSVLASFVQELSAGAVAAGIWAPTSKIVSESHHASPFFNWGEAGKAW
eukprot:Hpha_TRINITY_DN15764_c0_g11::TRINITY_DN15764_c0_g11_i1::g.41125::m.41125